MLNEGYVYRETLGASAAGQSVLGYLTRRYPHSSQEEWAERLRRREVLLEGVVAEAGALLRTGQRLDWHRPAWVEADVPTDFTVLHEDAAVLAVSKPSGLPTLPSGGFLKQTLLYRVRERFPEAMPLHRLGRGTSGLVLFARTHDAASRLARDWREGRVEKSYRALASGRAAEDAYAISAPIGLVPHPLLGTVYGASPRGKASRSVARVLERRSAETLFQVDIDTGRPDQIRIHLAFIGHPLVGDALFAAGGVPRSSAPALPGEGGYWLHSESLVFAHPVTRMPMKLEAPVMDARLRLRSPSR